MAEEKWYTGEFIKIIDETQNTKRFWIRVNDLERFDFKAGQFATMELPIHEKKPRRLRSYSIASAPDGTNVFELLIVLNEQGVGTPWIWQNIKVGSTIPVRGPLGVFTLPDPLEQDICFICTGTGIAPFRAMLHWLKAHPEVPRKNLYLLFGSRYMKDTLYNKEMEELQNELPNFKYVLTLSREDAADYTGRKGYVHALYEEIFADKRPCHFYLCGWRAMIDEAKKKLTELGYDRKSIHVELYG